MYRALTFWLEPHVGRVKIGCFAKEHGIVRMTPNQENYAMICMFIYIYIERERGILNHVGHTTKWFLHVPPKEVSPVVIVNAA